MRIRDILIVILLLLVSSSLEAKTYFVSCNGNDNNDGSTVEKAWASIARVNRANYKAGDKILFEAGCTFKGSLFFGATSKGTPDNPIEVGSYGKGRAVISSGTSYGITIYNTAGFKVRQLVFEGAGKETNKESGINFFMDMPNTRLTFINIDSVEVYGYYHYGIYIGSWNGESGFDDVRVTNSSVHDIGDTGITVFAQAVKGHRNVYMGYNKVYNNSGLPEKTDSHSGNGIVLGSVDGAVIEYCEAYNNGWLNSAQKGGPVGIWGWQCNNLIIQYNESYNNKTGSSKDGGGFDLDGGCTNSIMQYNYSHGNEGPGYLLAQYVNAPPMKGIIVRYNISENDARKNGYGAIHLWSSGSNGGIQDVEIYNNTVYLSKAGGKAPKALYIQSGGVKNVKIYNNIFQTEPGLELINLGRLTDVRFEGNSYWSGDGNFRVKWGSSVFTTAESWINATQEEIKGGVVRATLLDPQLTNPGRVGTISQPGKLHQISGYKLKSSSPLIETGLLLNKEYGINVGSSDFWGNSLAVLNTFSIGAHQFTMPETEDDPAPVEEEEDETESEDGEDEEETSPDEEDEGAPTPGGDEGEDGTVEEEEDNTEGEGTTPDDEDEEEGETTPGADEEDEGSTPDKDEEPGKDETTPGGDEGEDGTVPEEEDDNEGEGTTPVDEEGQGNEWPGNFFGIQREPGIVILKWTAPSGNGKKDIEVQLSFDNQFFRSIGYGKRTPGLADLSQAQFGAYNYKDFVKGIPGKRYYRLKHLNEHGRTMYSEIKEVEIFEEDVVGLVISPHPVKDKINLKVVSSSAGQFPLRVLDGKGRLVLQSQLSLSEGQNHLIIEFADHIYPSGMYLLVLELDDRLFQKKILK